MADVSVFLKGLGLKRQQNHLSNEPGSLLEASNVVLIRDNVIQQRRGFKLYGNQLGSTSDRAKQLFTYKERILRYYGTTLDYDTEVLNTQGQSVFAPFSGTFNEVVPGLRIKSIESNGNFYFTTDQGIQKISARTASDFSTSPGYITPAGGIKAANINTRLHIVNGNQSGFLPQDSVVAYRVLWNYTDINGNLVAGTPSQRSQIYNPLLNLLINDLDVFLQAIDNVGTQPGSIINDQDYFSTLGLNNSSTALQVRNNIINLANKLDLNIGTLVPTANILSTSINGGIGTISFANDSALYGKISVGDEIFLNGFSPTSGTLDGVQTVTGVNAIAGIEEQTPITFNSELTGNYTGKYFTLNAAADQAQFYIWFQVSGLGSDPAVPGLTGIQVNIGTAFTGTQIASAVATSLAAFSQYFTTSLSTSTITITNTDIGDTTDASNGTLSGVISIGLIVQGTSSTVTFSTDAIGPVTLVNQSIESGWFRSFTEPDAPINIIANDQELVNIQTYLSSILTELQINRNVTLVANNEGIPETNPLEITTAAVTGGTTLTINFDTSVTDTNALNQLVNGDFISLDGLWTGFGAEDLSGLHTVTTVNSGNIVVTLATAVTNGAVTIDTTSLINRVVRYTTEAQSIYITPLDITTTANVYVDIIVPPGVTTNNFFQIYRSQVNQATGTTVLSDLSASDEMGLVYEAFPTQAQIDSGLITVEDIVLDAFRGADLYTNPQTGEGLLQANDVPPLSQDINRFKNVIFYANTQTRQRLSLSLLGASNIIEEYNAGRNPSLTISSGNGSESNVYSFIPGVAQETQISFLQAETGSNYTSKYFTLNSANDYDQYYVWYQVNNVGTDPALADKLAILVLLSSGDSATTIASKTANAINVNIRDFESANTGSVLTIDNLDFGKATNATIGTFSGSTITATTPIVGVGESATQEVTTVTTTNSVSLGGKYWTINDVYNRHQYYIWYQVNGTGTDPALANKTGILVDVDSADTSTQVATKTSTKLNTISSFISTSSTNVITITDIKYGPTTASTAGTSGFTVVESVVGSLNVLLSEDTSPAKAVDITAKSLISIINQNKQEIVSGYYLSSESGIPGTMLLEARSLSVPTFYLQTSGSAAAPVQIGASFNPSLSPTNFITNISASNPTQITSTAHGLVNGDQIMISGTNSTPNVDGVYTISVVNANIFSIPVNVTGSGNVGGWTSLENANALAFSQNEVKPNRIYYSKSQQPEAVPIVNFLDIGAQDQAIIRIYPLRDSLMIFKKDGLYRLSGEIAPWNVALFDSSIIVTAPDSVSATNNFIYAWTTKGIMNVSEAGTSKVDRDIDIDTTMIQSSQFTNFNTATWGVGYDSANSYLAYSVSNPTDTEATIAYVYNTETRTWTTFDKTNTCGIINQIDDKLYLGAGDVNFIEQERKNFNRLDYADREFSSTLANNNYFDNGSTIKLPSVALYKQGDSLIQEQLLTIYDYDQLLRKLDLDPGLANDYYSTLKIVGDVNLNTHITDINPTIGLAAKLDADPGISNPNYRVPTLPKSGSIASNSASNPSVISLPVIDFAPTDVNTGTSIITITGSDFNLNQQVQFITTGTLPSGLNIGVTYFVVSPTTNTFKVSTSLGGLAVTLSTQGTGTHTIKLCHGLVNNRLVSINGVTGSLPTINGIQTVTVVDEFRFSVPVNVTTSGTGGLFETQDSDFRDIRAIYNNIINMLNLDTGAVFSNYMLNENTTIQESIITNVNPILNKITLNIQLPYVVGPVTIFESIISTVIYSPLTMGDPISYKQMNTCHVLFEDQTFTEATVSFATDLLPAFTDVTFPGFGNGTFGNKGFGLGFFGGQGNSQPFRTYIPRKAQRCTFMTVKFSHRIANEAYKLYGVGLSGNNSLSQRSYR